MRALQALMTALSLNQMLAESLEVGERGLAINPNDSEFVGEFGTRLALSGQWERGAALLTKALAGNPGRSGFYHAILALAAYLKQDNETAVSEIRQADLTELPLFHLVAAVIFAEGGLTADAQREGALFVKMRPGFLANIETELDKRNIKGDDQKRLIAGIRKAGLGADLSAPPLVQPAGSLNAGQ
jgi:adenylate cyclase